MRIVGTTISIICGDSGEIKVSCKDENDNFIPFVPGDIIYFTVKKSPSFTEKVMQKIITEFTEGTASITILPTDTQNLAAGNYYYDVQLNLLNGQVSTIIPPSKFYIESGVTHES